MNQIITATKPSNFGIFPYELQENQTLTLSCSAYVGAPNGNVKIWKLARNSTTNVLIFTANTSDFKTENCSEFINATFTYTVSRDDNGALFQCSSQNVLNEEAGPSLESQIHVSVKCKLKICCMLPLNRVPGINLIQMVFFKYYTLLGICSFHWACTYNV